MTTEAEVIDSFLSAMRAAGIETDETIIPDGSLHRCHVVGDHRGRRNGWYVLHIDERPAGKFGCYKRNPEGQAWSMKGCKPIPSEELQRIHARQVEQRKARAEQIARQQAAAASRAHELWEAAQPLDDDSHPYLKRKNIKGTDVRVSRWEVTDPETGVITVVSHCALLVPMYTGPEQLVSLQAIFPDKENPLRRDKDNLRHGQKVGAYHPIGEDVVDDTILLCEGFATAATLHEATGHMVLACIDCGNLMHVATMVRQRMPDLRICICADNDQWTTLPFPNPGLTYANKAAAEHKAIVVAPDFGARIDGKPTDFNDLAAVLGLDEVRNQVQLALATAGSPIPPPADDVPPVDLDDTNEWHGPADDVPAGDVVSTDDYAVKSKESLSPIEIDGRFIVLGYDKGEFFFQSIRAGQILSRRSDGMTDSFLLELAPLNHWEVTFPAEKGHNKKAAVDWLISTAHRRGIYQAEHRIRGVCASLDDNQFVYHCGSHLMVNGERMGVTDLQPSEYVYELGPQIGAPHDKTLSDEEGSRLVKLAARFRWFKPSSAVLLAGWVMMAPISGWLRWRPHIWLTGSAGSGKSTVLENFIQPCLSGTEIYAQGDSSEAGIRQTIQMAARPVIIDESEQSEETSQRRIQAIISLFRNASSMSGAKTLKGTPGGRAMSFHLQSMGCLSSIKVELRGNADLDRMSVLSLRPRSVGEHSGAEWDALKKEMHELIGSDPTFGARLQRRRIDLYQVIYLNTIVFTREAAKFFGSQRDGDQHGTLIAGAWSMTNSTVASAEQASQFIRGFDWSEHQNKTTGDDVDQTLESMLNRMPRLPGGIQASIYELIMSTQGMAVVDVGLNQKEAEAALARYGIFIQDKMLNINHGSDEFRNMLGDVGIGFRSSMKRMEGVEEKSVYIRHRKKSIRCIRVPIAAVYGDAPQAIGPQEAFVIE